MTDTSKARLYETPEAPSRLLTPAEVERFAADRVIHVSNVLSDAWMQRLETVVDTNATTSGLQAMEANVWHHDPTMHEVVMNCPVAHLAQQLLDALAPPDDPEPHGTEKPVRFFYDQMFVKHAEPTGISRTVDGQGDFGNTPWHQDITFWPVTGRQIVSIWIALDPTDLDNGGLEFVPGSSAMGERYQAIGVGNEGRLPFASDTLEALPAINSATTGETDAELSAITFPLARGDLLIFDANILHGAPANRSARPRRGLALRYLGSDVVLDSEKYGPNTVMAPFDVYDAALDDGDHARGPVYPQVLPRKIAAEIDTRLSGPITPVPEKMAAWSARNRAARVVAQAADD